MSTLRSVLNIDLLGPFGSGKGTQAELLKQDFELDHFVMGEALKQEIKAGTKIGKKIEPTVRSGNLVGDEVIADILEKNLLASDKELGMIFDGLPRNMDQKKIFDLLMTQYNREPLFLFIDISPSESVDRLNNRKVCGKCGDKPIGPNFTAAECASCGGKIVSRYDDRPHVIKQRLQVYENEVRPVIEEYLRAGVMHRVNGEQEPLDVHAEIMNVLSKQNFKPKNELHKK